MRVRIKFMWLVGLNWFCSQPAIGQPLPPINGRIDDQPAVARILTEFERGSFLEPSR